MRELLPLIEQIKLEPHPFVVVTITEKGIHWHAESKEACEVMGKILGNCKVMPREGFIEVLENLDKDSE